MAQNIEGKDYKVRSIVRFLLNLSPIFIDDSPITDNKLFCKEKVIFCNFCLLLYPRWNENSINSVLACSALKKSYRLQLVSDTVENKSNCCKTTSINQSNMSGEVALCNTSVLYVYLNGSMEVISDRMSKRLDHFMPTMLLQSQFQDLEEPQQPENFIGIDVAGSVNDIVHEIIQKAFITDKDQNLR